MATTISEAKENYQCVFYAIGRMMVSITMPEPWKFKAHQLIGLWPTQWPKSVVAYHRASLHGRGRCWS